MPTANGVAIVAPASVIASTEPRSTASAERPWEPSPSATMLPPVMRTEAVCPVPNLPNAK